MISIAALGLKTWIAVLVPVAVTVAMGNRCEAEDDGGD